MRISEQDTEVAMARMQLARAVEWARVASVYHPDSWGSDYLGRSNEAIKRERELWGLRVVNWYEVAPEVYDWSRDDH